MTIKTFLYLIKKDKKKRFFKIFLKRPFFYTKNLFRSFFVAPIRKRGIFYFDTNPKEFKNLLKDNPHSLVLAFSYCQKPQDCPNKRFSSSCKSLPQSPCSNCIIGKTKSLLKDPNSFFITTTVDSFANRLYDIIEKNKTPIFISTACFFSIKTFQRYSYIMGAKGIALPLIGNVCKNFSTFLKAEEKEKKDSTYLFSLSENILENLFKK